MFRSDALHQTYDLRLEEMLSDPCQFHLFFRGEDSAGTNRVDGTSSRVHFRQLQPAGDFLYFLPKLQFQARYDLTTTKAATGALEDDRRLDRLTSLLAWRPDRLPGVTLEAVRYGTHDSTAGIDLTETRLQRSLDYAFHQLKLIETNRYTTLDDGQAVFARKSTDTQGEVAYEDSFFGGRASVSASALATWTRLDERAGGNQAVSVPTSVTIAQASYAFDDSPLDDRDHPLVSTPSLIDGNFKQATGISLGPDSSSYQNIAVDMGRVVSLDSLRLHVRDSGGNLVPSGGSVTWNVYVSADGLSWNPAAGGAATAFSPPMSLYEVTFVPATSRYFKVVNFGVNTTDTQLTEIESFFHTAFAPRETRRTNILLTSGTASVAGKPADWATLTYYGLFNSSRQEVQDAPRLTTADSDQIFSAIVDPARFLDVTLRYEKRGLSQTGGYRQTFDTYSGLFRFTVLPTFVTTVEATRTNENDAGQRSVTDGLTLRNYARLLPAVDVSLNVGNSRQRFTTATYAVDQTFANGVSIAQLTTDLKLILTAAYESTRTRGELVATSDTVGIPPARNGRYEAELFYRPGQQLGLAARVGWVSSVQVSGLTQYYHAEWFPFAEGALSLGTTYDQDVDAYANVKSRRLMLTPRWTLNRHAVLDVNYTRLWQSGLATTKTTSFFVTLTMTF